MQCSCAPSRRSGILVSRGLAIRLVGWVETDWQGRAGLRGGGEVRGSQERRDFVGNASFLGGG
jgi:hypothetical protein